MIFAKNFFTLGEMVTSLNFQASRKAMNALSEKESTIWMPQNNLEMYLFRRKIEAVYPRL